VDGGLTVPSKLLRVAETVKLGSESVSLLGHSNVWVKESLTGSLSMRLTQSIVAEALENSAPGQLEVIVFDDGLSGIAAPFYPLNTGGEHLLTVVHDESDFREQLRVLRDHVQRVKNVMRGETESLVQFRELADYPVESYKLVVVSADFSLLSNSVQNDLYTLLKSAPSAGVSFLIHSPILDADLYVEECNLLRVERNVIEKSDGDSIIGWSPRTSTELVSLSERIGQAPLEMDKIEFSAVQSLEESSRWSEKSSDGITFSLGIYGKERAEITLGDELNQRHNMLITGAVGQGKSNLINVIVHSLCQRYSPDELHLYLLDFKEGVSLKPLASEDSYLPHARVLGLDADREFGLSLLKKLFDIYQARMKLFKDNEVQSLREYRERKEAILPRIVVVIDEYQMMFAERDRTSDEIADLLMRGVRLFRACGIHIILASQTIGGSVALMGSGGEGLFAQVPIRLALKNSLAESYATLGARNDAAVHLRSKQAIVNLDYGEVSANRKTSIAFADRDGLT